MRRAKTVAHCRLARRGKAIRWLDRTRGASPKWCDVRRLFLRRRLSVASGSSGMSLRVVSANHHEPSLPAPGARPPLVAWRVGSYSMLPTV